MNLSTHRAAIPQVKAFAKAQLTTLKDTYRLAKDDAVHAQYMYREIKNFLDDPEDFKALPAPKIPDGSPIGCFQE